MSISKTSFLSQPVKPCRDGEGDGEAASASAAAIAAAEAAAATAAAEADANANAAADTNKVTADGFSPEQQAKVNALLAKQKTKMQEQLRSTQQRLEALSQTTALNDEERESLLAARNELEKQLKTRAQLEAEERAKIQRDYDQKLADAQSEVTRLKEERDRQTVDAALLTAFSDADAFNPELSMVHLQPFTKLSEDRSKILVHFPNPNPTSEEDAVLVFTPEEAVKHMKTIPDKYGNLFKTNVAAGIGGGSTSAGFNPNTGEIDVSKLSYAEYLEHTRGSKSK